SRRRFGYEVTKPFRDHFLTVAGRDGLPLSYSVFDAGGRLADRSLERLRDWKSSRMKALRGNAVPHARQGISSPRKTRKVSSCKGRQRAAAGPGRTGCALAA